MRALSPAEWAADNARMAARHQPAPPCLSPTAGRAVEIGGRKYIEAADGWLDEIDPTAGRTMVDALEAAHQREGRAEYLHRMGDTPPMSDWLNAYMDRRIAEFLEGRK